MKGDLTVLTSNRIRGLGLLLIGLLVVTGCGGDDDDDGGSASADGQVSTTVADDAGGSTVGVTDDAIVISSVGSFSGPYAAIYDAVYQASTETWAADVNANGGINGRKIELKKVDDKFSVEGSVAACKEIESNGSFAAFTQSLFPEGLDCLDKAGIPAHQNTIQGDPDSFDWTHVHGITSNGTEGKSLARYVGGDKGIAEKGATVGLVYVADAPPMAATASAFKKEAEKLGLDVQEEKLSTGQASFTAEVQRLKDAGIDVVVMSGTTEILGVLRDAAAIGYKPTFTGQYFVADEFSLAIGVDLFKGIVGRRAWGTTDTPAWDDYLEIVNKYDLVDAPPTTTGMSSFYSLRVMEEAMRLAGDDLTRESFLAAYDKIVDLDLGGLPPVTYKGGRMVGADTAFTIECCQADKTWKGLGPAS
jgi:ABC-type branched-subunit amino acid transport system substrate-binding protein